MNSFKTITLRLKSVATRSPTVVLGCCSGFAFVGINAMLDYNRDISDYCDLSMFAAEYPPSPNLEIHLKDLHKSTLNRTLTFNKLMANRSTCKEVYYLSEKALKRKEELQNDEYFKLQFNATIESTIESVIASEYNLFTRRMCRRSMIRNGYFSLWFKATWKETQLYFMQASRVV